MCITSYNILVLLMVRHMDACLDQLLVSFHVLNTILVPSTLGKFVSHPHPLVLINKLR